jgi:anti-anti-sigma regulatory factor
MVGKETPKLMHSIRHEPGLARIVLSGAISEYSELNALANLVREPEVVIDLADIDRINSAGIREWLDFVQSFTQGRKVSFTRMSPPMVRNLNLISSLLGKGSLISVMAPYMCERCDELLNIVVDVAQGPSLSTKPLCPKCDQPMEFADLWSIYFAFLQLH